MDEKSDFVKVQIKFLHGLAFTSTPLYILQRQGFSREQLHATVRPSKNIYIPAQPEDQPNAPMCQTPHTNVYTVMTKTEKRASRS